MKRVDLIRHIEASGCAFLREGGRHTFYVNPTARKVSTVPRHREINEFMAKKICRELEIDDPGSLKITHFAFLSSSDCIDVLAVGEPSFEGHENA